MKHRDTTRCQLSPAIFPTAGINLTIEHGINNAVTWIAFFNPQKIASIYAMVASLLVTPTLATSYFNIISVKDKTIGLYNGNGQLVRNLVTGVNDISSLPKGVYYVKTINEVVRVIKQKLLYSL